MPGKPLLTGDYDVLSCSQSTDERYDLLKDIMSDTVVVITVDDHGAWEQIRRHGDLAKLTGVLDASSVWSGLTPEQQKTVRLPQVVQKRLEAAGVLDGKADAAIGRGTASVPWQRVLRGYVGREFHRCPTYSRPSRRMPLFVGVIPGAARQSGRPRILSVIDTSGSISAQMLAAISAELAAMSRMYTVIVAECDTKVHAVYPYKPIQTVHGRGGTDLRPPFEAGFLRQHRPDLLIYFSDGCGKAPEVPPSIPVIWCLTPSGRIPCTWGREVRMG